MAMKGSIRALGRGLKRVLEWNLNPIERFLVDHLAREGALNLIVIVGPARSGTTLLYQCLISRFRVGYVTNLVGKFGRTPVCISVLCPLLVGYRRRGDFQSSYGKGRGIAGVNQGHAIWARWFHAASPRRLLSAEEIKMFRGTLRGLQLFCGCPLVIKWPGFAAHIQPLMDAVPEAVIIRLRRNPLHVAKSIYKGRVDLTGSASRPISRSPDGSHCVTYSDPVASVCAYVASIERELDRVLQKYPGSHYSISYEELCLNPTRVLDDFNEWYEAHKGTRLRVVGKLPARFDVSEGPPLNANIVQRMLDKLRELGLCDGTVIQDNTGTWPVDRQSELG